MNTSVGYPKEPMVQTVDNTLSDDEYDLILTKNTMEMFEDSIINYDIKNAQASPSANGSERLKQLPPLYIKLYTKVEVYETSVNGQNLMRRCKDDWVNSTQILKAADFPKSKRTRILEKEIQVEEHEKLQGGNGSVQGTWVPLNIARKMAKKHNLFLSIESATKLKHLQLILYFDKNKLKDKLHVLSQKQTTTPNKRKKANQLASSSSTSSFKKLKNGVKPINNVVRTFSSLKKERVTNCSNNPAPISPISPTPLSNIQFQQHQSIQNQNQQLALQQPSHSHYVSMHQLSVNTSHSAPSVITSTPTTSSFRMSSFTNKLANSTPTTTISPQILTFQSLQMDSSTPNPSTPISSAHASNKFSKIFNHAASLDTSNMTNNNDTKNISTMITPMAQPSHSLNDSLFTPIADTTSHMVNGSDNLNMKLLSNSTPNLQHASGLGDNVLSNNYSSDNNAKSPLNQKMVSSTLKGQTSIFQVDSSKPAKKRRGRKPKSVATHDIANTSNDAQQQNLEVRNFKKQDESSVNYNKQLIEYFRKGNENNIPKFILNFDISNNHNNFQINSPIDSEGHSTLHWAAAMGNVKLVEVLISDKIQASPLVENALGLNPLCRSVTFNNCYKKNVFDKMIECLKSALFVPDSNNRIILHYLCQFAEKKDREASVLYYFDSVVNELKFQNDYCNDQMLKLKKERFARMNIDNKISSNIDKVQILNVKVGFTECSSSSSTSSIASSNFQLLNNTTKNNNTLTPTSPSFQNNNHPNISIDNEKDSFMKMIVNHRDDQGNTPLHLAIRSRCAPLIRKLLAFGADLSVLNLNGDIPLNMLKAINGHTFLSENLGSIQLMIDQANGVDNGSLSDNQLNLSNENNTDNSLMPLVQNKDLHSFPQIIANNISSRYIFDNSSNNMLPDNNTEISPEPQNELKQNFITTSGSTLLTSISVNKQLNDAHIQSGGNTIDKNDVYQVPIENEDGTINLANFKRIYNEFFNRLEYSLLHDFQAWDDKTKEVIVKNNKKVADLQLVQDRIRNKLSLIFSDFVIFSTHKKKSYSKDKLLLLMIGKDSTDSDDTINEEDEEDDGDGKEEIELQTDINNEHDRQILNKLEILLNSNAIDFLKILNEELSKKMINLESNFFQKHEIFKKLVDRSQAKSVADCVIKEEQKIHQNEIKKAKNTGSDLNEKLRLMIELSKIQRKRSMNVSQYMETCANHTISRRFNNYRKLISISCDLKFESIDELIDGIEQAVILSNTAAGPNVSATLDGTVDQSMIMDSIGLVYNDTSRMQL